MRTNLSVFPSSCVLYPSVFLFVHSSVQLSPSPIVCSLPCLSFCPAIYQSQSCTTKFALYALYLQPWPISSFYFKLFLQILLLCSTAPCFTSFLFIGLIYFVHPYLGVCHFFRKMRITDNKKRLFFLFPSLLALIFYFKTILCGPSVVLSCLYLTRTQQIRLIGQCICHCLVISTFRFVGAYISISFCKITV